MEMAKTVVVALAVLMMAALMFSEAEAQATATCAASLAPCGSYINATHPPATCCTPLKNAIATQKDCLCNIFNDPSILKSFGINVTDALTLPTRCNITSASSNLCSASSPSSPPTATTTTNTSTTPAGSGTNAADIVSWSGVSFVLAVMASLVLY